MSRANRWKEIPSVENKSTIPEEKNKKTETVPINKYEHPSGVNEKSVGEQVVQLLAQEDLMTVFKVIPFRHKEISQTFGSIIERSRHEVKSIALNLYRKYNINLFDAASIKAAAEQNLNNITAMAEITGSLAMIEPYCKAGRKWLAGSKKFKDMQLEDIVRPATPNPEWLETLLSSSNNGLQIIKKVITENQALLRTKHNEKMRGESHPTVVKYLDKQFSNLILQLQNISSGAEDLKNDAAEFFDIILINGAGSEETNKFFIKLRDRQNEIRLKMKSGRISSSDYPWTLFQSFYDSFEKLNIKD